MSAWSDHAGTLELPDGRKVRGTGLRTPRKMIESPDFAVYLLGHAPPEQTWECRWVKWRDFGVPASTIDAVDALREAFGKALEDRVEIACGGGVGRTGTALALMAVMAGLPAGDATAWIRRRYHPRAIETRSQGRWLLETAQLL